MRARTCSLLLALMPLVAAAAQNDTLGLSYVDTSACRLVYVDSLGYLVPHAIQTLTNSLAWQRRTFDWTPSERIVGLLKDFSDYGNAAAGASPHDRFSFDIGPLSHAFETYPATDRMYTLMNHELVHVATGDVAADYERRWRKFFAGKVYPRAQNPETLLYSQLTAPRANAPRWYNEGSAVFMETWMAGGLGRAQGGYDEMVFRAMVRDNAYFYSPVGLESEGVNSDFQVGVNDYLYGTRFMSYLALTYSPERVVQW